MKSIKRFLSLSLITSALALGVTAAPALAIERFATPGGSASGTCLTEDTACDLEFAIENAAVDGDVVSVLPGSYTETTGIFDTIAVEIRGLPGQPMPTLTSTVAGPALAISNTNASIRRLRVVHNPPSGSDPAVQIDSGGGTIEQVIASTSSSAGTASGCGTVNAASGSLIRDTICSGTTAGGVRLNAGAGASTITLRNVTAIGGTSGGGLVTTTSPGETLTVNGTNVIADGTGAVVDVLSQGAGTTTVTFDHSNYATSSASATSTITVAGSATNQTAVPVYVNAAGGDFHQLAASPTRNAGIGGAGLGSADVDGEARTQEGTPDIGGDEFTPPPPPADTDGDGVPDASDACPAEAGPASNNGCPLPAGGGGSGDTGGGDTGGGTGGGDGGGGGAQPDTDDPETEITKKPKKGLKAGDTAKVRFESDEDDATFECKVAKGKFKRCTSPLKVKDLEKGKTKVQIRAIDAAGNVDETPAKLTIVAGNQKENR